MMDCPEVYLDNAATMTKYPEAILAEANFYTQIDANPLRGLYKKSIQVTTGVEACRRAILELVGADDEYLVILTRGATEALNLVMRGLKKENDGFGLVEENDKVAVDIESHHSNLLAAKMTYSELKILKGDSTDEWQEAVQGAKLISLTGVSNATGENLMARVKKVREALPEAILGVDGAQMVGHAEINLKALMVDYIAFSGHKFGSPMGVGGLVIRRTLAEKMRPLMFGGGAVEAVDETGWPTLAEGAERFEAGTLATGAIFGLKVAAERALTDLREGKNQKIKEITQRAAKRLEESGEVEVLATNGGIITFNVRGVHPHDTAQILADEGVAVRAGFLCAEPFLKYQEWGPVVRASFSVFNTEMDGERLVEAVKKVRKRMGI